eukprot:TRINITY_DN80907_c0_g1_i1.p2 TRINITY_DN80907_c0_g1~~TRINITY_DN80907_c0_g1_i1.p2  ORF type:complete len:150 (-),score=22.71 TRINITY_DN80907_c0_g1_i1:29-478(-)
MYLRFTSDGSGTGSGFTANRQFVSPPRPQRHTVYDSATTYQTNLNCGRQLLSSAHLVALTMTSFQTEAARNPYIYDGASATAPLIVALSGNIALPYRVVSTGQSLYLKFTTESGWAATVVPSTTSCGSKSSYAVYGRPILLHFSEVMLH